MVTTSTDFSFDNFMASELMTKSFEAQKYQLITSATVGALSDLGYVVNLDAADGWPQGQNQSEDSGGRRRAKGSDYTLRSTSTISLEGRIFHPEVVIM